MEDIISKRKEDRTLYDCCEDDDDAIPCIVGVSPRLQDGPVPLYISNITRKEFVRLEDLPEEFPDDPGWHIHPLPLLTCSGNGRGGGDFMEENGHVGLWAGDYIAAEYVYPVEYIEITPNFSERAKRE